MALFRGSKPPFRRARSRRPWIASRQAAKLYVCGLRLPPAACGPPIRRSSAIFHTLGTNRHGCDRRDSTIALILWRGLGSPRAVRTFSHLLIDGSWQGETAERLTAQLRLSSSTSGRKAGPTRRNAFGGWFVGFVLSRQEAAGHREAHQRVGRSAPSAHPIPVESPGKLARSARQMPHDGEAGVTRVIGPWADRWLNGLGTRARKKRQR